MKINRIALAGLASVAALSGCGPQAPVRGSQYFKGHPAEATAMDAKCKAGEATGGECDAAAQAVASIKADATFDNALKTTKRDDGTKNTKW